eukprot:gene3697-3957_t
MAQHGAGTCVTLEQLKALLDQIKLGDIDGDQHPLSITWLAGGGHRRGRCQVKLKELQISRQHAKVSLTRLNQQAVV